jgi:hypothetical protein
MEVRILSMMVVGAKQKAIAKTPNEAAVPLTWSAKLTRHMDKKIPHPQRTTKSKALSFDIHGGQELREYSRTEMRFPNKSRKMPSTGTTKNPVENQKPSETPCCSSEKESLKKLTSVLKSCGIPTGRDRASKKPLLGKLGGILKEDNGGARFKERERLDAPESPWKLHDLAQLEFLVLLAQPLSRGRVTTSPDLAIGNLSKPVEDPSHDIRNQVHEDSHAEYPGKVTGILSQYQHQQGIQDPWKRKES